MNNPGKIGNSLVAKNVDLGGFLLIVSTYLINYFF